MTLVFLSIRTDMVGVSLEESVKDSVDAPVNAGEHVGPSFGVRRKLDFHRVGVVVENFVDMARIAAQRAAHEDQRLAGPTAGSWRRRVVTERVMPEQLVMPVLAVVGEDAVGGEAFLAVAGLAGVLDQIKTVKVDAGDHMGEGRP